VRRGCAKRVGCDGLCSPLSGPCFCSCNCSCTWNTTTTAPPATAAAAANSRAGHTTQEQTNKAAAAAAQPPVLVNANKAHSTCSGQVGPQRAGGIRWKRAVPRSNLNPPDFFTPECVVLCCWRLKFGGAHPRINRVELVRMSVGLERSWCRLASPHCCIRC
jgi:hypothetical protein